MRHSSATASAISLTGLASVPARRKNPVTQHHYITARTTRSYATTTATAPFCPAVVSEDMRVSASAARSSTSLSGVASFGFATGTVSACVATLSCHCWYRRMLLLFSHLFFNHVRCRKNSRFITCRMASFA